MKVRDWTEIDAPWFEYPNYSRVILDKISFLDILDKCKVEYWPCSAGDFTHRARCPLPIHDFGSERTPSMYIDEDKNEFYCFGCNSKGNLIDFYSTIKKLPYHIALEYLSNQININDLDLDKLNVSTKVKSYTKTIEDYVFKSGILIRDYLSSIKNPSLYKKRCMWANKQFCKLDSFLDNNDENTVNKATRYFKKLSRYIENKK